jgi:hypothetical protein
MFSNGVTVMDVTDPKKPRPVNFLPTPLNTWSLHLQAHDDLLLVVNAVNIYSPAISIEKTHPTVVGRWWIPGMWREGGETPSWPGRRYALHHAIVAGTTAYGSWRDGGSTPG